LAGEFIPGGYGFDVAMIIPSGRLLAFISRGRHVTCENEDDPHSSRAFVGWFRAGQKIFNRYGVIFERDFPRIC